MRAKRAIQQSIETTGKIKEDTVITWNWAVLFCRVSTTSSTSFQQRPGTHGKRDEGRQAGAGDRGTPSSLLLCSRLRDASAPPGTQRLFELPLRLILPSSGVKATQKEAGELRASVNLLLFRRFLLPAQEFLPPQRLGSEKSFCILPLYLYFSVQTSGIWWATVWGEKLVQLWG